MEKIKVKYNSFSNFEFLQAIQKIASTPTTAAKANTIRKITNALQEGRVKTVVEDYKKEIMEVFAKRNEAGEIVRPDGEPDGFEPIEGKEEECKAATEAFGEKFLEISAEKLTPATLSEVKLSARELELLGDIFTDVENAGPGVPNIRAVK